MKELLLNIFCPAVSKSYDFWIPQNMKVSVVIDLLCEDIIEYENNPDLFTEKEGLLLCSYLAGHTLSGELTLEQAGIRSGDRLVMV